MTDFATPRQQTRRTAAALEAALGAGRDLGLTVTDPRVLHDLFSVVVHLAPAPVVVRVPTVLPPTEGVDGLARRQRDELAVTRWLAEQGTPVIPPSPLVPAEPVRRDGFSLTFWQYFQEAREAEPDYTANAELVARLHRSLHGYPGTLDFLATAAPDSVTDALLRLESLPELIGPADLDRARREWRTLEPLVRSQAAFEEAFPGIEVQPVHGDSPAANIFSGTEGRLYADFELVTLGPVEWDMALLGPELEAAYNRGAERCGARRLDPRVMRFVNAVGMLRVVATLALVPQLPVLADYLKPALAQWATMPFAGGLAEGRTSAADALGGRTE